MNCVLIHDWLNWSEPYLKKYGEDYYQQRKCSMCGKIEERKI
jgi:hypothetical protein